MNDTLLERYYGSDVEVHVFARDGQSEGFREFVRKVKLARSPESTGKLLDKFGSEEVYHVPETNTLYFHGTFTDYDIVGTVDGSDCLIMYCDFYAAWNIDEVEHLLKQEGWASPGNLP